MLDIDKIYSDFQELISSFDSESLDEWLRFDEERLMLSRLLSGETIVCSIVALEQGTTTITNRQGMTESHGDNYQYRTAA
jgi:hypothetical protein